MPTGNDNMQIKNWAKESLYKFIFDKSMYKYKTFCTTDLQALQLLHIVNSNLLCANSTFSDECCDEGKV